MVQQSPHCKHSDWQFFSGDFVSIAASCPFMITVSNIRENCNGGFMQTDTRTNGRITYKGAEESNSQCCVWWHRTWNHWWIGDCTNHKGNNGNNAGFSYLEPKVNCPTDASSWHGKPAAIVQAAGTCKLPYLSL